MYLEEAKRIYNACGEDMATEDEYYEAGGYLEGHAAGMAKALTPHPIDEAKAGDEIVGYALTSHIDPAERYVEMHFGTLCSNGELLVSNWDNNMEFYPTHFTPVLKNATLPTQQPDGQKGLTMNNAIQTLQSELSRLTLLRSTENTNKTQLETKIAQMDVIIRDLTGAITKLNARQIGEAVMRITDTLPCLKAISGVPPVVRVPRPRLDTVVVKPQVDNKKLNIKAQGLKNGR